MAGVSHPAFRLLAKRGGAGLVYTEMVSAVGLDRGDRRTWILCQTLPAERPVALQLFGADPAVMERAARLASRLPVDLLDLNLGCPVKKIRRQGAGSALLEDLGRARELVAAAVAGSTLPVTVKIRLGPTRDDTGKIVPPLVAAGAAAVCLHARTTRQAFSGRADWGAIARLAAWCPVPVIGNGDVTTARGAVALLKETGAAAVMIGRASRGDPWIFGRAAERLAGREPTPPDPLARRADLKEHLDLALDLGGEGHAVHFLKQFIMYFTKGHQGAAAFRRAAGQAIELAELWRLVDEFWGRLAEEAA